MTQEEARLQENRERKDHWRRWGPYLSERQWGTVREDYSRDGDAWNYFPHEHAHCRVYRWGEDGLCGISDNHQRLCFAVSLWNGEDDILKERVFGLNGREGNHGEDVKDYYFYLDNTPTHSYMKCLYKYPQAKFPYRQLVEENQRRGLNDPEFELLDTGVFADNRYYDVEIEYAKAGAEDILVRITATNRGPEAKKLYLLPTLWFRNTWDWDKNSPKPGLSLVKEGDTAVIQADHPTLGQRWLHCESARDYLFTGNETNQQRLYGQPNAAPYVKDAFHDFLIAGDTAAVNPQRTGTKMAPLYELVIPAGEAKTVRLRLTDNRKFSGKFDNTFDDIFNQQSAAADEFYAHVTPYDLSEEERRVQRQAFAGMLWSKQYYHYVVEDWLKGDIIPAPAERWHGRNAQWQHLYNDDILSMPDKWEYPWFAAWDAAFHMIPFAMIDSDFAKRQLELYTREWYMHPNGQIPAYEWNFGDVNPPVHAWAAMRVFQIERAARGQGDYLFLERVFQKLLLNFTWWVNRKDVEGNNVFEGGFLGMDNIGVFDRSRELPIGGDLHQADGTSWMAMYCLNMLSIAMELALQNKAYEDIASKFFEHFIRIAQAMNSIGEEGINLWDEEDGFYFDVAHTHNQNIPFKIYSMVGLIPLFAIEVLKPEVIDKLPGFKKRMQWFINHRQDLCDNISCLKSTGTDNRLVLSLVNMDRLKRILKRFLNEAEFLSDYGIRTVSKYHEAHPYVFRVNDEAFKVTYTPGESDVDLFGGNSNWRGPVWFPVTYLLIEALQKFHYYLGDDYKVQIPAGSNNEHTLWEVSQLIADRLINIFLPDDEGVRPCFRELTAVNRDPHWKNNLLFFEYFHGDTGRGVGAQHQTGWTGLVAKLIHQRSKFRSRNPKERIENAGSSSPLSV